MTSALQATEFIRLLCNCPGTLQNSSDLLATRQINVHLLGKNAETVSR